MIFFRIQAFKNDAGFVFDRLIIIRAGLMDYLEMFYERCQNRRQSIIDGLGTLRAAMEKKYRIARGYSKFFFGVFDISAEKPCSYRISDQRYFLIRKIFHGTDESNTN